MMRACRSQGGWYEKISVAMMALGGAIFFTAPAYVSEMWDAVHRKTIGGLKYEQ